MGIIVCIDLKLWNTLDSHPKCAVVVLFYFPICLSEVVIMNTAGVKALWSQCATQLVQIPAVMCSWKGGRYTVREWVAGLTVNRSLFLLCHVAPNCRWHRKKVADVLVYLHWWEIYCIDTGNKLHRRRKNNWLPTSFVNTCPISWFTQEKEEKML